MKSKVDWSIALTYLSDYLKGSLLYEHLPPSALQKECLEIEVVCSRELPRSHDYRYGWGAKAKVANDWLIAEMVAYLHADDGNMGIIEDPCGEPSDPGLTAGASGPAWFHRNRVLWPITQDMANPDLVSKAMKWGLAGKRQVIAFGKSPRSVHNLATDLDTSEELIWEVGTSIARLITDVFDGEGYLVWHRRLSA